MNSQPPREGVCGPDRRSRSPLIIGITGPIGCGKSTVAGLLAELGGTVIDADVLARRATEPGGATLAPIRDRFGEGVFQPNGELDRAAMAALAFDNADALADLERIIHPEVRQMVEEALEAASQDDAPFVVIEAIKLVEGGLADRCDEVWLVTCDPEMQRERLLARGATADDADQRIAAQGPDLAARLALEIENGTRPASRVRRLSTDGSLEDTRERMETALAEAFEGDSRPG